MTPLNHSGTSPGHDKVSELARAFDLMAEHLEKTYENLRHEIALRQETQEALSAARQTARTLLNAPRDTAILTDAQGAILAVNDITAVRYGCPAKELIGASLLDLIPTESRQTVREHLRKACLTAEAVDFEEEANGRRLEYAMRPVPDDQGGVGRLAIYIYDITESRQVEQELVDRAGQYQALFEDNHFVMMLVDPETEQIIDVNKAACVFYGYTRTELVTMTMAKINLLPIEEILSGMNRVTDGRRSFCQCLSRPSRGDIRHVEVFCGPISVSGQDLLYYIVHDVTERKWVEEERRRLNRAKVTLSECNQAIIHAQDDDTLLNEVCRKIVQAGGYDFTWVGLAQNDQEKTVLPAAWYGFEEGYLGSVNTSWADNNLGQCPIGKVIRSGVPFCVANITGSEEPGNWRTEAIKRGFTSIMALPLISGDETLGALAIYSEEKDAFDQAEIDLLMELAGDLAYAIMALRLRKSHEITEEETKKLERQLRQAQKMEAIGTLAGGIAHDFNNILGAIMGYCQLALLKVPQDSRLEHYLKQMLQAGGRASELVNQILTFSRQTEQKCVPTTVNPIIKEALKLLRASLPSTIEIRQAIPNDCGHIMADPTQIHQVLMNLCTNAAHAMAASGGVLTVALNEIELEQSPATHGTELVPGRYLHLTVSDTGHGIDPDTLDRIFEPYFTTKGPTEGTGLGLAVVHGIIKGVHGSITVSSTPGQGTVFNVYFPTIEREITAKQPNVTPLKNGCERIMLVDDEELLVDVGKIMLERLGYQVVGCTRSLEALDLFVADPTGFDLVITDLTMPGMVGLDLARKITEINPNVPVIICTGSIDAISPESASMAGVKGVAEKPLLMEDMSELVRSVLAEQAMSPI